jgi:hypothetical protein
MTLKGKVTAVELVEFNSAKKTFTYEFLTENSSSGRLYLEGDDRVPKKGDTIIAISDSDGNVLNYSFND